MAVSPGSMKVFLQTFVVFLVIFQVKSSKLNVPRVLLPFSENPPSFQLSADSGCYVWSSTRPDVIKIKQTEQTCSSSASISAVSRGGSKVSVGVLAEDKVTGLVLRADVIVDSVRSLRIVTKTHELYKEETPEKFEVRAYDEQGNEFSTLQGMVFKWNIEAGRTGAEILRFIPWADSPYNTEHILESLEAEGKQGNKVLLEGIKTGSAKVSARLVDSLNPSVPPTSESLMVVANLFLVPPVAYILPGAKLKYSANQFRGSRMFEVSLPSPHHQLVVGEELASLDQASATLTGIKIGSTQVELVDQNVDAGEVVKTPTADLHVVPPARLEIICLPFKSWSVLVGQSYQLQVTVFDKESNKIHLSDNLVIDLAYDNSYLSITDSLENGTLHHFNPIQPGQTNVKATLRGVKVDGVLSELPTPLHATGTLDISDRMTLDPPLVTYPWDPVRAVSRKVKYTVKGGSSPYTWVSTNGSIGTVSQLGVGTVTTGSIGESVIVASMTRAAHNKAMGKVVVAPAVSLKFLESELEFPMGSTISIPLALYDDNSEVFFRCDLLPYTTVLSDNLGFTAEIVDQRSPGCAGVQLASNKLAHTKVTVDYSYPSPDTSKPVILEDSRTVATYKPLVPEYPSTGETVAAVESSVQVVWTGGPQPWPLQPSSHYRKLTVQQESLVKVENLNDEGGIYAYRVECRSLGETTLTLSVGNEPSQSLPRPVVSTSTVKVVCGTPASIHLAPKIHGPVGLPPCPAAAKAGRIATQAYRNLDIDVTIKDANGRVFDGIDSVAIDWQLSDGTLAKFSSATGTLRSTGLDWLQSPGKPYQTLQVMKKTGKLDVKASLPKTGFLSSTPSDSVKLVLVEDARIDPDSIEIFHHNKAQDVAKAVQGSGYFILEIQQKGICKATYKPENQYISVTPSQPGTTNLILKDLCLAAETPAQSSLTVRGVVRVELDVLDKIQQGREVEGTVRLYAANNQVLGEDVLQYVSLSVSPQSDVVSLGQMATLNPMVTGSNLGQTTVIATAEYHGIKVSSPPAPVQVFPPLRIEPRNITLLIGAAFQVVTTGGPSDATIQYYLSDVEIGDVSNDGLVTGSTLGSCTLVGRAVGRSKTGELVEYSRDSVQVHVVALSALRLFAPTKKIVVDGAVPIYLLGQDDNINAYSFGSAIPHLDVSWTVTGHADVRTLASPWASTGLALTSTNTGVAVFRGKSVGKALVTVRARITSSIGGLQYQLMQDRELTASIEITVVDRFHARVPEQCTNHVLMAPGATLQLHTNRDGRSTFTGIGSDAASGIVVSKRGMVTAGRSPTTAVLLSSVEEETGVFQQTSWVTEIRPVHYVIMESAPTSWKIDSESTKVLPRGGQLDVQVSCHDVLGRQFAACPTDLAIRPSRFDLVKSSPLTNSSFTLTSLGVGHTVLRVVDRLSGEVAWGGLQVDEAISVPKQMTQGDVLDLGLLVKHSAKGVWSAEPAGILDVSSKSGTAVAIGTGHVRVKYTSPEHEVFYTDVSVKGSTGVLISGDDVITRSSTGSLIPIRFTSHGSDTNVLSALSNLDEIHPGKLFKCLAAWDHGDIDQVFSITPAITSTGWACKFTPTGSTPDTPAAVNLRIESVKGKVVGAGSVQFLPPFSVASQILEVGPDGAVLKVSGHFDVLSYMSTKGEGVYLESGWMEDGNLMLPVSLHTPIPKEAWVTILNTRTLQEERINVQPTFQGSGESRGLLVSILKDLWLNYQTVLTILVVSGFSIYMFRHNGPKPAPAPAPSPSKKPEAAPGSGEKSPTPYLWTVDNSPIYGSPMLRRTSPTQARNLSQYSYS